jgi:hypothetical protein
VHARRVPDAKRILLLADSKQPIRMDPIPSATNRPEWFNQHMHNTPAAFRVTDGYKLFVIVENDNVPASSLDATGPASLFGLEPGVCIVSYQ